MSRSKIIDVFEEVPTTIDEPTELPGLLLWLDSLDVGGGVVPDPAEGGAVSTWYDRSGNENHFAAVGIPPVWSATSFSSLPGINFTATGGLRAPAGFSHTTQKCTICVVGFQGDNQYALFDTLDGANRLLCWLSATSILTAWFFQNGVLGGSQINETGKSKALWIFDSARSPQCELRHNGVTLATHGTFIDQNLANNFTLGDLYVGTIPTLWQGVLSEVIIYDRALSTVEITQVESYLGTRWGGI